MAGLNKVAFVGGCETMPIWLFFLSSSFSTQTKGNRHLTQNVDLINSSLPAWYSGKAWKSSIRCTFGQFFNLEIRLRGRSMSNVIVIVGDLFVQTALPVVFSVGVVLPIDHCRNMEGGCGGGRGPTSIWALGEKESKCVSQFWGTLLGWAATFGRES